MKNRRLILPPFPTLLNQMERRQFLRMAAGSALTAAGLHGCGAGGTTGTDDGNDDGPDGPGDTPGPGITPAQRGASIQGVLGRVEALTNQPRETRLANILTYLNNQPEIIGSGMNEDGVWGVYADGAPLMILDNREPLEVPEELPPSVPAAVGSEVPDSIRARFIQTLGSAFTNEIPRLAPLLSGNGYAIASDPGTIESLMSMQGDGVFYMGAHGGQCTIAERDSAGNLRIDADGRAIGRSAFGIWTSSPFDPAIPNQYWSAIVAGQVGIGIARNSKTPPHNAARYFITSQFVRDLMKPFGADSLVCFGACHSMSAMSAAFAVELAAKNAGLVVGWSHVVDTFAIIAAYRFIFDRLLGDNSTNPKESPPQRPFDYEEVWADLKKHGLHLHPNSNGPVTEIRYHAGPGSFGLLAPSIQFVLINESADQAILKGIFGKPPPGERAVLIGGLEAAVVSWEKEEIVCTLPRSGTGSAGDVEVWVRGHKSNVRRITEWNIPMRFAFKDPDHPPLKVSGDVFLRFRADVGDYRSHTHEAPFQPIVGAVATRDSSALLMGSGSAVIDECTVSWLGEYEFPASGFGDPFASALVARFRVDTETKKGAVGLALLALPPVPLPFTIRSVCPDGSGEVKITVAFGELFGEELFPDPGNDPDRPEVPLPAVQISFDPANYSFPGGAFEDITTGLVRLEWDPVMPNFPPDPEAARVPALISAQQAG